MTRILIAIFIALNFQACTQEKTILEKPTIDNRVELMSIVFRLAEKQEYSNKRFKPYVNRIEQYFEKYKDHELIQFTRSIMSEYGIAFDGPMWLAVHLDDHLKPLPGVKDVWQLDPRWTKENVEKFVPLLQKFYKDTRFDNFLKSNADLYAEVVRRFAPIYDQVDPNWCFSFFGKKPKEIFSIKIGLGTGGNCYGVYLDDTNGNRRVYAIMGIQSFDHTGLPEFSTLFDLPLVIHEFSHPFIDNLTEKNKEIFRESGEKIFSVAKNVIGIEAYPSWQIVLDEALVHASVIKYMKDHDFKQSEIETWIKLLEENFGFFWIEELVDELENYEIQRDKYPTLESYMPELAEAYKIWTENILTSTHSDE
ncbi:MAG: DUF4932 domain-containing protein [Bacteroidales bacterium]|nr:DUF4932 domain-containing protein [Bacteroidales bacterium]